MSDHDTRTDALCTTAGIYRSDCADQERFTLAVGDTFPSVPVAGKRSAGTWPSPLRTPQKQAMREKPSRKSKVRSK
jgi:hypothetical protein